MKQVQPHHVRQQQLRMGWPRFCSQSYTGADSAAELEQLRRELEAANLQVQDRDKRLAVADADCHNLQFQVDAQLHNKDHQLAETLHTAEMAKHQGQDILTELGQTREALSDMHKDREVLQCM